MPLIIFNASPLHGVFVKKSAKGKAKAKAKIDWVDVTSDDDEEEEKEEEEEEEEEEEGEGEGEGEEEGEKENDQKEDDHEEEEDGDEENEDDKRTNDEGNKGKPPVIKYGLPLGKHKKMSSSAQHMTHPGVTGPSTTPALEHVLKASNTGKASKPPSTFQSQAPLMRQTMSNALSVSRPSKTKKSVAMNGLNSEQALFQLMKSI